MRPHLLVFALLVGCGASTPPGPAAVEPLAWIELRTGGASETETLPLIIALHGRGDRAEGFVRAFEGFETPARVALLRAPIREGENAAWFTFHRPNPWRRVAEDLDQVSDRVVATIDEITATRPTRGLPIAMGFSQGGNLAYTLALRHPTRFHAILPVSSGFIETALEWEHFDVPNTPPIIAFHGRQDPVIPLSADVDSVALLQGLGVRITLHEHDAPHWMVPAMREDVQAELRRWVTEP